MSDTNGVIPPLELHSLQGKPVQLSDYRGQVLLIVNTASACGFTPQYQGLEELYQRYRERGFAVLAFPCNQFGQQEPGSAADIAMFCSSRFQVSFPIFDKVEVNGPNTDPLFAFLKKAAPGLLGTSAIKWNFTKFLVDREGKVVARYASAHTPQDMAGDIENLL
ncbi:glutathione peroxidase [Lacisediminimonas sp.]|uniref:glutathione peroxidase n=1 Tax=Lacisediminimonas sp. TaxID=3060582 RepID=UPI00351D5DC4